jgi:TP901 family phage tail tape measure protein
MPPGRDPVTGRFTSNNSGGGGGFNIGSAFGVITLSFDGSGVQQAQNALNGLQNMGAGLQSLGQQLTSLGAQMTLVTAPIAAFGAQGIQAASNFQDALAEIGVRAGLTAAEMDAVRTKALDIGRDTVFSAGQASEAFLQLLTTGQSLEEAMSTIDAVMAGAAASGADLGQVADSVTDIMAQFQLEASASTDVVNALAQAAGASSATMTDLIAGFQNVGGVAANFSLSIGDTAAILATFSENGIKGAEAGTQLRSMLNNMARSTDPVQAMWKKLNVSMFDAAGKMRPLNDIIRDMNVSMKDWTQQDRLEAIQTLAGTYGQMGLTALLNADGFGAMSAAMADSTSAAEVADAKMNTFSGSIESLRGSVETLQINALTPLMDQALTPLIQGVTDVVNSINDWVVANPELAGQIAQILAVVVTIGPILAAAGVAISFIGTALGGLGTILGVLLSPVVLIGGAIAALILGLDALGIIDLGPIILAFQNFFGAIVAGVDPFEAFATLIGDLFGTEAEQFVVTGFEEITRVINDIVTAVQDFAANHMDFIVAMGAIGVAVGGLTLIMYGWSVATGAVTVGLGLLGTALGILFSPVVILTLLIAGIVYALSQLYPGGLGGLLRDAATAAQQLAFIFMFVLNTAATIVRAKLEELHNTIMDVIQGIRDFLGLSGNNSNISTETRQNLVDSVLTKIRSQDSGGSGFAGMPYLIGSGAQPELFVPSTNGTFIPNADKMMGGGDTYNVNINANTYEGGQNAARGFEEEMRLRRRSRG